MSRFSSIIEEVRSRRALLLIKKRPSMRKGSKRKVKATKLSFDSPELEALFNKMPKEMQDLVRKGR